MQLVRALVSGQPILLLDEPFSAMDRETGDLIQRKLLALPGKTILVVTHDLTPERLNLYDEVLRLQNGRLMFAGSLAGGAGASPLHLYRNQSFS